MAFSLPNVLLLGHSFFRRLQQALYSSQHPYCISNFGLQQCNVTFFTVSGWTVGDKAKQIEPLQERVRSLFQRGHFEAVVIQLGDNDCCNLGLFSCLGLASLLDDFGQWLIRECGVKIVYICQLFTRPQPRNVSPAVYEQRRSKVNEYLEVLLEDLDSIKFWKHRRIFESPHNVFDEDGCHLNEIGMKKFYKSIRQAIILAVESVN